MKIAEHDNELGASRYVGWLDVDHTALPTRCYVQDISRVGAKLTVFSASVPDEFTLHFNRKGDAKVRCRVTSRTGPNCAVEFVASLAIYDRNPVMRA